MYENLILPVVLFLVIIFIIAGPAACYLALRKIADPVPSWLPLALATLAFLVMGGLLWSGVIGESNTLASVLVIYSLTFLLLSLAIATPYLWFKNRAGIDRPWLIFSMLSIISIALVFFSTMGEHRTGELLPPFSPDLLLTGWIFDGLAGIFSLQEIVYSPVLQVHTILYTLGLYLQTLIIAAVYFSFMNVGRSN
ncbi:MAG: hypothetical protein WC379_14105 [Methanoregula sp.]|jgi:hypothetical protein